MANFMGTVAAKHLQVMATKLHTIPHQTPIEVSEPLERLYLTVEKWNPVAGFHLDETQPLGFIFPHGYC